MTLLNISILLNINLEIVLNLRQSERCPISDFSIYGGYFFMVHKVNKNEKILFFETKVIDHAKSRITKYSEISETVSINKLKS